MHTQLKRVVALVLLLIYPLVTLVFMQVAFPSSLSAQTQILKSPVSLKAKKPPPRGIPVPLLAGDINLNGRLEIMDIELLRQYLEGKLGLVAPQYCYDVNSDGVVDLADLVALTQLVNTVADGSQGGVIEDILIGDVTGDGVLDERDLILLSEYIYGVAKIPTSDDIADFDRNGVVDLDDLLALVDFYYGGSGLKKARKKDPGHRPMPKLPSPRPGKKKPAGKPRLK